MATVVSFNGASYSVPAYGDSGWAQGSGNLSSYLVAIAAGTLQTTGGTFTLSANVNFGATYGVLSKYFQTVAASPATAGVVRLALSDTINWGAANNALGVSGTDLQWNGVNVLTTANFTITDNREVYIAGTPLNNYTGSLTVINMVTAYVPNGKNLTVCINGLTADMTYDYAETNSLTITFNSALNVGDRVRLNWSTHS